LSNKMKVTILILLMNSALVACNNQRTALYDKVFNRDRSQLQAKIDLLVQEIIGLKSRLRTMTASLHALGNSLQEMKADFKGIKVNVNANTDAVKGLLSDYHRTEKEMKDLDLHINKNTDDVDGLHTSINSLEEGLASSKETTVSYPTSELVWQSQEIIGEARKIEKGKLMATIPTMDRQYKVSLEFNGDNSGSYGNIIHFTAGGNDIAKYGDWIPCIYYNGGVLEISSAVNGNPYFYRTAVVAPNLWHSIEVSQELVGDQYFYTVNVDGNRVTRIVNNKTEVFHDVKVYMSDPWYTPQSGYIRNFNFHSTAQKMNKAKSYYTDYKALFLGFGESATSSSIEHQSVAHTLEECLLACSTKHETAPRWNGIQFDSMDNNCYCVKDNSGHTPTKNVLHYKFMEK